MSKKKTPEKKPSTRVSELVEKAMAGFEKRLDDEEFRPTLSEYLKLMQIEKELGENEPREITVTWVEPEPESKT